MRANGLGTFGFVAAFSVPMVALAAPASPRSAKDEQAAHAKSGHTIVETAIAAGNFKTLVTAVKAAELAETLSGKGPFTVFAPTDEAFAKLPKGTVEALVQNPPKLRSILKYHVVPGRVLAADVVKLRTAKTALGQMLKIDTSDGVKIAGASVVKTDIQCSNGVIHVIDSVILPKADIIDVAEKAGAFNTLLAAVRAAGLEDALRSEGPFTVFAPTDEAFAKLPKGTVEGLLKDIPTLKAILTYHVVPGAVTAKKVVKMHEAKTLQGQSIQITASNAVKVNDANVVKTDVHAANGIIHVIDSVMMPPAH